MKLGVLVAATCAVLACNANSSGTSSGTDGADTGDTDDASASAPTDTDPGDSDSSADTSQTDPSDPTDSDSDSDSDTDPTGEPVCEGTQFGDEPQAWTLPALELPIAAEQPLATLADNWACDNDESFRYTTADLDGDRVLDLVVTDACDAAVVGVDGWLWYRGGDGGFADEPELWRLPDHGFAVADTQPLAALADNWACTNDESFRFTTLDITADGVVDLVVTDACDAGDVGDALWLVYPGDDDGFADEPQPWMLPQLDFPIVEPEPMQALADNWACTNDESFRYTTLDITADGVLDLVVTDACDAGDVGETLWLVYPGGDGGFADEPQAWMLPALELPIVEPEPMQALADNWACTNDESFRYTTLDITADGVLDLVVTDACDAGDVGDAIWLVYAGGDDGFADEPSAWSLPDHGFPVVESESLATLADNWACTNDQSFRYQTMDVTGDGMLDLVVTDACDAGDVGVVLWLVYAGSDSGFADEPSGWTLPEHGLSIAEPQPLANTANNWACDNEQSFRFATLGLDSESHVDLVVTDACDAGDVGVVLWLYYPGECG